MKIRIFAIFKKSLYIAAVEPFLRDNGIEVVATCTNLNLALDHYKNISADLVMMDANWPDIENSPTADLVIQQLKKHNPEVRIIAATNFFDGRMLSKLKAMDIQGYFFKNMDDTLEQIKQCIVHVNDKETYYVTPEILPALR